MANSFIPYGCPFRFAANILGDRWSWLVLRDILFKNYRYYGEFLTAGEGISTNVLAARLMHLESEGMITRSPDPAHGSKIIYMPTDKALAIVPIMTATIEWASQFDDQCEFPIEMLKKLRKNPKEFQNHIVGQNIV